MFGKCAILYANLRLKCITAVSIERLVGSMVQGNGSIFIFGDGDCGQLGFGEDVTERLRPAPLDVDGKRFVQVVCGGMHTAALSKDGSVYTWGVNDEGALGRPTPDKVWNESPESSEYPDRGDPYKPGRDRKSVV